MIDRVLVQVSSKPLDRGNSEILLKATGVLITV